MLKEQERSLYHYGLIVWFVAALFYAIEFFQRVAPTVLASPISVAFAITPATLGFVMSLYYYVYGIAQIPVGLLFDRYQARWLLAAAAFVVSLGTLLFVYAHYIWALAIGRILIGFGSAFGFIGCLKLARDWFSNKQFAFIVGLTNTIGVIGALTGQEPLAMLEEIIGWQHSLLITVACGLIISVLIIAIVRNRNFKHCGEPIQQQPVMDSLRIIFKSKQAWLISIYAGLMVSPVIAFAELWSVGYLEKAQHLTSILASETNSLIFVGIAIGGPINGWVSGLLGRRKPVMYVGTVVSLLLFIFLIEGPVLSLLAIDVVMFMFGFFVSSMLVSFSLNVENHPENISATVIGFTNMFISIIGAVFQILIGLVLQYIGHVTSLLYAGANDFKMPLVVLPIALFFNLFILLFIRESKCCNS